MNRVLRGLLVTVAIGLMASAITEAHITIAPNQSMAGATEKYVLRVPSEGKVATVAADLDIPEGVVVETSPYRTVGSTSSNETATVGSWESSGRLNVVVAARGDSLKDLLVLEVRLVPAPRGK